MNLLSVEKRGGGGWWGGAADVWRGGSELWDWPSCLTGTGKHDMQGTLVTQTGDVLAFAHVRRGRRGREGASAKLTASGEAMRHHDTKGEGVKRRPCWAKMLENLLLVSKKKLMSFLVSLHL